MPGSMITIAGIEIPAVFILALISGLIWVVRSEGKQNMQEKEISDIKKNQDKEIGDLKKDIERIEIANQEHFKDMLHTMKEIQIATNQMSREMATVMTEVKHMNTKITRLESGKVLPILQKFFDEEGNLKSED